MQESSVYRSIYAEAETKATANTKREIALNLLRRGLSVDIVADDTGL
jgi:DNA-binding NarL/FixJ family response regulator